MEITVYLQMKTEGSTYIYNVQLFVNIIYNSKHIKVFFIRHDLQLEAYIKMFFINALVTTSIKLQSNLL
jgi:hypothetical protein